MRLFDMDPTAQWMALMGAGCLLLGVIAVIVFVRMFARERDEARAEAAESARENVRLRELYAGLLNRSDVPALQARLKQALNDKASVLGDNDVLRQRLTDKGAELAETIGKHEDCARMVGKLHEVLAAEKFESMKLRGQLEDQAAQLEQQAVDIQRLRQASRVADVAQLAEALKRLEEQGERDRVTIEQLEAELAEARAAVRHG